MKQKKKDSKLISYDNYCNLLWELQFGGFRDKSRATKQLAMFYWHTIDTEEALDNAIKECCTDEKTADEMFTELGYKKYECRYHGKLLEDDKLMAIDYDREDGHSISFWISNKSFYAGDYYEPLNIDMPTFKAIQEKIKELGWLDE